MILPRLGTWNLCAGKYLIWERLYKNGYKWTPFCKVSLRYHKTLRQYLNEGELKNDIR